MKSKLINLLTVLGEYLKTFFITIGAMLPTLLVLDFGMGIQLHRDYGLPIVIGFIAAQVFYAAVYARYIHDS
jgi:hypothetical protein